MNFLQKLDKLIAGKGLNKHTLAQESGIPYTTIVGLYERGADNARLSTLNKLCSFFHCSLDYLAFDEYENPDDFVPNGKTVPATWQTPEEQELLSLFRILNPAGRAAVMVTVRGFAGNPAMQKEDTSSRMA